MVDELSKLGEMWVFGKDVKGREVYIKIMLGVWDVKPSVYRFIWQNIHWSAHLKQRRSDYEESIYR